MNSTKKCTNLTDLIDYLQAYLFIKDEITVTKTEVIATTECPLTKLMIEMMANKLPAYVIKANGNEITIVFDRTEYPYDSDRDSEILDYNDDMDEYCDEEKSYYVNNQPNIPKGEGFPIIKNVFEDNSLSENDVIGLDESDYLFEEVYRNATKDDLVLEINNDNINEYASDIENEYPDFFHFICEMDNDKKWRFKEWNK